MSAASEPLVSLITPTANREHLLPHAYGWVAGQSWSNWEWLVLDDGPAPSAILSEIQDDRVRYQHSTRRLTVGEKRNRLVAAARGDIIVHIDDDDFYAPDYVRFMVAALAEHKADFVKLSASFIYSRLYRMVGYWDLMQKDGLHFVWSDGPLRPVMAGDQNRHSLIDNHLAYGFSYVYRKSAWAAYPFPHADWNEDLPFAKAIAEDFPTHLVADRQGLCLHVIHGRNSSHVLPQYILPDFMLDTYFPPALRGLIEALG